MKPTYGIIYLNKIHDLIQLPQVFQARQIDLCTPPDKSKRMKRQREKERNKDQYSVHESLSYGPFNL